MTEPGARVKVKDAVVENGRLFGGSGGLLSVQSCRLLLTSNRHPISGSPRQLGNPPMRLQTSDAKETVLNVVLT